MLTIDNMYSIRHLFLSSPLSSSLLSFPSLSSIPSLSPSPSLSPPTSQLEGERNYHIFYRLLAGMPAQHLAKLHLVKNPREYGYLTKVTGERRGRGTEGKGEEEEEGEGGRREGKEGNN